MLASISCQSCHKSVFSPQTREPTSHSRHACCLATRALVLENRILQRLSKAHGIDHNTTVGMIAACQANSNAKEKFEISRRTYARAKHFKDPSPCLATIPARGTHSRVPLTRADGFLFAGSLLNRSRTTDATSSASVGIRKSAIYAYIANKINRRLIKGRCMRHG